ncbi:protein kinase [Chloroflexus sp. MS-CIW-1]|uniref:protein kinase domain-containing protein n=1 Tax=Chloroflexus sp. MS-CIW-1 TaxID=3055768 RepID=UPI0026496CAD|nr:protein kinase [Chloroflexus sp. MS-CIW-1]MDN5272140.1 protein kinase [Chloroflexus sp. MS-CIW-1]
MTTNTPSTPSLPRVFGHYEVEQQIGRGESSRVFRAHHRQIKEHKVALKVLLSQEAARIRRFEQEARIAARLRHPHISRLLDYGFQNPFHYVVFEYIPGVSLRDRIKGRDQRLPPDKVLIYFRQIADALDYAHSHDFIHRDLSPGNILIDEQEHKAYLIDFGIARDPDHSLTSTNMVMGTPGFIAPESLISASNATHLSDIFSLGVVLFFMLTGEEPWYETPTPPVSRESFARIRTLAEAGAKLPSEVDRIIRVLLAFDREHRYTSAGAAASDLEIALRRHLTQTYVVTGDPVVPVTTSHTQRQIALIEQNEVEQVLSGSLFREPLERALERARKLDDVSIRQLLDQWSKTKRFYRPLLGRIAQIHDTKHQNVFFFSLRLLIEQRREAGLEEEPDSQQKQIPPQRELALWQIELPPPKEFREHPGGRVIVPGSEQIVTCPSCKGQGVIICPTCQGQRRVTVPEQPVDQQPKSNSADSPAVVRQRVVPCSACSGRGSLPCKRCESFGRLVQRKVMEWSRRVVKDSVHNDLPDVDEAWLHRTCKAELVYRNRVQRIPPEWLQISEVKEMIELQQKQLDKDGQIVMAELQINFIPLTEIKLDLGKPEEEYRLAIYGFENLIPPDWRFLHWERIGFISLTVVLATFLLICLVVLLG